jgi:RimJ/RimL family protein N-acetyltransferase
MAEKITDVTIKPMTQDDLELLLSWRSHPDAYAFFRAQTGPLKWQEHFKFWKNRKNREDFIIYYLEDKKWRKVGSLNVSALNTEYPEVGIIIGELTAHHKGIGSKALSLGIAYLKKKGYTKARAVIHKDNLASQKLFTKSNFVPSEWQEYILDTTT